METRSHGITKLNWFVLRNGRLITVVCFVCLCYEDKGEALPGPRFTMCKSEMCQQVSATHCVRYGNHAGNIPAGGMRLYIPLMEPEMCACGCRSSIQRFKSAVTTNAKQWVELNSKLFNNRFICGCSPLKMWKMGFLISQKYKPTRL